MKIRTLAAHSTKPAAQLTERTLKTWISSFGLDVERIKVLAVSLNSEAADLQDQVDHPVQPVVLANHLPSRTTRLYGQLRANGISNPPIQQQLAAAHYIHLGHATASAPVPLGLLLSSNTALVQASASNANQAPQQLAGFGVPLQSFANNQATNHTFTVIPTNLALNMLYGDLACAQMSLIIARLDGWLHFASEKEVQEWIMLKNTDLRAGEQWLLYVSNAAKRVRVLAEGCA
jgi:hypothetical protein